MQSKHPWIARLVVASTMLFLAFVGILLTDLEVSGGWTFWKWTVGIYAVLTLSLSWYTRKLKEVANPITLWHELLHWLALFGAVILVSLYVDMGLLSRTTAGLFILTLLSLTVFTIGIYLEPTFLLIGLVLGIFASLVAVTVKYLYALTVPVLLIALGLLLYLVLRSRNGSSKNKSE